MGSLEAVPLLSAMVALKPDFWTFLANLETQTCCSSGVGAINSMSLAVVGS